MLQTQAIFRNLLAAALLFLAPLSAATTVIMQTPLGDIEIELFEEDAPGTVANFLNYVDDGDYEDSFIHRSVPGFVIQGGGYTFRNDEVDLVPTDPPIANEFKRLNLRGTIAMAKAGGDPDSATSQWFINLSDNPELDQDDGAGGGFYTVFGQVSEAGMAVVDAIAALPRVNAGAPLNELPVRNWNGGNTILKENLVFANVVRANEPPVTGECDSRYVRQNPDELVLEVAPTGADDTGNIQCALDLAAESGLPVVRLEKAGYTISSILVSDFNGSFQGTTRADSVLNILDRSIDCAAMESQGLTAAAIKFVRGEPRLRFMTINAVNPCISGDPLDVLLHFTGLDANDSGCGNDVIFGSVDRVTLNGPGRAATVTTAAGVSPEAAALGGCKDTLLGTFKLNRSEINGFDTGIGSSMKASAQVDINFNTFNNLSTAIALTDSNQSTTISGNEINSANADPARNLAYGILIETTGPSAPTRTRVVIHNNKFNFVDSTGNPAIPIAAGVFNGAIQDASVVITGNRFDLNGEQLIAIQGTDIDNATVAANRFNGFSRFGIVVDSQHAQAASGWTITANTGFGNLVAQPDILLGSGSENIIVGPGQGAVTDDQGNGNSVL